MITYTVHHDIPLRGEVIECDPIFLAKEVQDVIEQHQTGMFIRMRMHNEYLFIYLRGDIRIDFVHR